MDEADWARGFEALSATWPVVATEWGPRPGQADDPEALRWCRALVDYLDQRALGWAAWSWADEPRLVVDAPGGDYRPTAFGRLVQEALAR
jgi:hypothetical protein